MKQAIQPQGIAAAGLHHTTRTKPRSRRFPHSGESVQVPDNKQCKLGIALQADPAPLPIAVTGILCYIRIEWGLRVLCPQKGFPRWARLVGIGVNFVDAETGRNKYSSIFVEYKPEQATRPRGIAQAETRAATYHLGEPGSNQTRETQQGSRHQ